MKYGARYIRWAPVLSENPDGASLPTYRGSMSLGGLQKVTDNPSFTEAKGHEDDGLAVHVNEFIECPVDVEIGDLANEVASSVLGSKLDEGEDLHFGADDNAPDGGMAFFISKMKKGNVKSYQCIFYPLLKAAMQGEEYTSKAGSITLTGDKLHFLARASATGDWKIKSKEFSTKEEAIAWIDGKLPAEAAAAAAASEGEA